MVVAMKLVTKKMAQLEVDREWRILLQVSFFPIFLQPLGWKLTCRTARFGDISDDARTITSSI